MVARGELEKALYTEKEPRHLSNLLLVNKDSEPG
jgi:hypothetical protein